jgi:hypothetical protein
MTLQSLLIWLEHTSTATAIRESTSLFPWLESIHVLAITTVVGTIAMVDLRLLGLASRERPVSELMAQVLPFTRGAFVVAAMTGSLLFASHASDYLHKAPFVAKLFLLGTALINIVVFHFLTARDIRTWDTASQLPIAVKCAGGLSLAVWVAVVACGRWTGFV